MIVKIYKEESGVPVLAGTFTEKAKDTKYGTLYNIIVKRCGEVFGGNVVSLPKLVIYRNEEGASTFRVRKGDDASWEGRRESIILSRTTEEDIVAMTDCVYVKDGVEHTENFGAEFIDEGFVISTGVRTSNFLGITKPSYLVGIGKRNVKSAHRAGARLFPTAQTALAFIEKNEHVFSQMAGRNGWKPALEFCSPVYEEYVEETMTEKKKANMRVALEKANAILADCVRNAAEPEKEYGNTVEEEAVIRMKELRLMNTVVRHYKDGTLMMSEFGGILYYLDEEARKAAAAAVNRDLHPYHVVKSGSMYAVLYVSPEKEEWEMERLDPDGYMLAFVKNGEIEELGSIGIESCNGGVMRTA